MAQPFSVLAEALQDRYVLDHELGSGGMATVYLAHDVRHRRQVAVKVLRPELAASLGSDRFFREIGVAARLQHPHILPLLDSGEAAGFYYYVMPFIAGESLRGRLGRLGELPVQEAIKVLIEVVDALASAHAAGVVHRDIKPDNVMLSGRHALVMDFGVAKAVSEATGRQEITTAGIALGTPAYMAPEQAAADPHLDHRVDIYAVGAMGYELLVGHPPFEGSSHEVLRAHMTRMPEPLSAQRPAVPPQLAAVIMKCLEKHAADRYQSAEELLAQLEPLATPSGGMTPTHTRPLEGVSKRTLVRWTTGAVAVTAAVVIGGAAALLAARRERPQPVSLRDRVQLTSTGRVSLPSIAPDGKQLAYVVTDCSGARCTYGLELMDVGGTATRRILDSASALSLASWSSDRRNLLVTGSVNGRWGSYLISTLGGTPRLVSPEPFARFDATGDSVLSGQAVRPDGICWVRIAGLDGVPRDSVRVPGSFGWYGVVGGVPGTPWFIVAALRAGAIEFIALDRHGREGGRSVHEFPGGWAAWRAASDALWIWWAGPVAGGDARAPLVRIAFDRRAGRFAARADTVYTGRMTAFDVTGDGTAVILDEGTEEFSAWAMDLTDAFKGAFLEQHRVLRATAPLDVRLAPAGNQLLVRRSGGLDARDRLSVLPLSGGGEVSVPLSGGSLVDWGWTPRSGAIALQEKAAAGVQFTLLDAQGGMRRQSFSVPDHGIRTWTALPDDGWIWKPVGANTLKLQRPGEKAPSTITLPAWYNDIGYLSAAADGQAIALSGWGPAPASDSFTVGVLSLRNGGFTRWVSTVADAGGGIVLADGSLLLEVSETRESIALYHLRKPGEFKRLGAIPRPVQRLTVSQDLKRVALVTREYHGDAWMYRVIRR